MSGVRLFAHNPDSIAAFLIVGLNDRVRVRAHDNRVFGNDSKVFRDGGCLVNVVPTHAVSNRARHRLTKRTRDHV